MSLELLKILIESACADGIVTEEEMTHLSKKAEETGVSLEDLNFMITSELEKVKSQTQWLKQPGGQFQQNDLSSGFVNTAENDLSSGFISSDNTSQSVANNDIQSKFTDITTLDDQGAMSIVQKAKHYGKWLIIKSLKQEFKDNNQYRELFLKEFENAYHLDHPNIVRIFDKGEDSERLYYTMEFIDGQRLTKLIGTSGMQDTALIKRIYLQMLDALSYVHKKQIFHRDLKPDNILITFKGDNVKILDFGLAAADCFDDNLQKVGTPRYAAPEQSNKNIQTDQKADIYSAGLILLEMLTGQIKKLDTQKIEDDVFIEIIKKSTQPVPDNRYSGCGEISKILTSQVQTITTIPNWLEDKIREFAADGVITKNERTVLELEAKNNNIDIKTIDAFLHLELEKVKTARKKREKAEQKHKEIEKQRAEAEKKRQKKIQAQRKKLDRQIRRSSPDAIARRRKRRRRIIYAVIILLIFLFIKRQRVKDIFREHFASYTEGNELPKMYVIAKGLNLRSGNSRESKIIDAFPYGTEVVVFEESGGWARIRVDGQTGYMATKYLATGEEFLQREARDLK